MADVVAEKQKDFPQKLQAALQKLKSSPAKRVSRNGPLAGDSDSEEDVKFYEAYRNRKRPATENKGQQNVDNDASKSNSMLKSLATPPDTDSDKEVTVHEATKTVAEVMKEEMEVFDKEKEIDSDETVSDVEVAEWLEGRGIVQTDNLKPFPTAFEKHVKGDWRLTGAELRGELLLTEMLMLNWGNRNQEHFDKIFKGILAKEYVGDREYPKRIPASHFFRGTRENQLSKHEETKKMFPIKTEQVQKKLEVIEKIIDAVYDDKDMVPYFLSINGKLQTLLRTLEEDL